MKRIMDNLPLEKRVELQISSPRVRIKSIMSALKTIGKNSGYNITFLLTPSLFVLLYFFLPYFNIYFYYSCIYIRT